MRETIITADYWREYFGSNILGSTIMPFPS